MAVYGYTRVSTKRQADEGESLDVQNRTISGYLLMHGLELDHVYIESGVSGSVPLTDRPQGKALLAALKPGDVVVTPKLDRMFRSALDALDVLSKLKGMGVSLHMVDLGGDTTQNGISKLIFTILSAVAEAERDRIRERIATVKADQKKRGCFLGGIMPFGYRAENGMLIEVPEQQEAIREILAMRAEGASLRRIAGVMNKRGVKISHVAVSNIIERAGNAA